MLFLIIHVYSLYMCGLLPLISLNFLIEYSNILQGRVWYDRIIALNEKELNKWLTRALTQISKVHTKFTLI